MKKMKMKKVCQGIIIGLIIVLSILIRIRFMGKVTEDFTWFLNKWFYTLKENGGIFALKEKIGDYNLPYLQMMALLTYLPIKPLYSIKIISILFDYIGAFAIAMLIHQFTKNKKSSILGFLIVINLPTVILNASCWAQCDFIYATFIILSLLYLIKDKFTQAFIFLGIAFSFKLQTIFVLPIFILYYISERKFPIYYFLLVPIINFVLCIPSLLVGKPIGDMLKIYIGQTQENSQYISMNFPGIYPIFFNSMDGFKISLIQTPNPYAVWISTGIVGMLYFLFACLVFWKKIKFSKELLIKFSIWSVLICTYLLPKMHDRYMFVVDVLSIALGIIDFRKWYVAIGSQIASLYVYTKYLWGDLIPIDISYISILLGFMLMIYSICIFKELQIFNRNYITGKEKVKDGR